MAVNKKKISDYTPDGQNINRGSEYGNALLGKSLQEVGLGRSVLADKNGVLIAGNKTVEKAAELGFEDVIEVETDGKTLVVVKRTDLDINSEMGAKAKILDNTVSKHNYVEDADISEAICEEYNLDPTPLGLTAEYESEDEKPEDNATYTRNVEAPVYEAKNEKPQAADLYSPSVTNELLQQIQGADLSEEDKAFLTMAAYRHTVFHYERIADYYANSSKEVQELMERSALVIIDFNKAIEYGFVELTKSIQEQYSEDYDEE